MSPVLVRRGTPRAGSLSAAARLTQPSGESENVAVWLDVLAQHWAEESGSTRWGVLRLSPSGGEGLAWVVQFGAREGDGEPSARRARALALLRSWIAEGDADHDTETRRLLLTGLNEAREGQRQFPE
jgi:hypothetical protein